MHFARRDRAVDAGKMHGSFAAAQDDSAVLPALLQDESVVARSCAKDAVVDLWRSQSPVAGSDLGPSKAVAKLLMAVPAYAGASNAHV
jgi:hypothetical protein